MYEWMKWLQWVSEIFHQTQRVLSDKNHWSMQIGWEYSHTQKMNDRAREILNVPNSIFRFWILSDGMQTLNEYIIVIENWQTFFSRRHFLIHSIIDRHLWNV